MRTTSINRLRRLVQLTEHIHTERARDLAETEKAHAVAAEQLLASQRYLDESGLVGSLFPSLLLKRAVRFGREVDTINAELQLQIEAVAAARASVKGLEGKLQREVASGMQEETAKALEETIERFVQMSRTSLR
jgi:hypothetical protein